MFSVLALTLAIAQVPQPTYFWQASTTQAGVIYLYKPGKCNGTSCEPPTIVGGWMEAEGIYRTYDAATKKWGPVSKPPIAPPNRKKLPTGVDPKRLTAPPYTYSGVTLTAEEAKATLTDDSTLPHLTIIANKDQWRTVLDYFPADFKAETRLHCYPPDHRDAKKFAPQGITAVFQEPDGRVVAKQTNLDSKALADSFMKTCIPDKPTPRKLPPAVPILAGLVGVLLWLRRLQ